MPGLNNNNTSAVNFRSACLFPFFLSCSRYSSMRSPSMWSLNSGWQNQRKKLRIYLGGCIPLSVIRRARRSVLRRRLIVIRGVCCWPNTYAENKLTILTCGASGKQAFIIVHSSHLRSEAELRRARHSSFIIHSSGFSPDSS